ncbi:MAG TPA: electron transfer flavoprotein subunit beta/FixA family protein [Terriglobia bacterium]|nr:electron transfer flavoprotein subunit beta/FixA family protein [Terriglobia bacterium]
MKIFSCIKPVVDPATRLSINESKTWIKTQDATFVASEADNYALEEALRLREKHSGETVVVSLGGEESAKVLRAGLAMGADRAIHLSDALFRGATEFNVAEALARAVEKDGGADLVLAGVQSDDLGTGVTGVMLAEFLGWSHATVAISITANPEAKTAQVERELEGGVMESVEIPLPAVVTVQYGANQPRYASLKGIMAAKKKPFVVWSAQDVGITQSDSLLDVKELFVPEKKSKVEILSGTPEESVTLLVEKLRKEAKVL